MVWLIELADCSQSFSLDDRDMIYTRRNNVCCCTFPFFLVIHWVHKRNEVILVFIRKKQIFLPTIRFPFLILSDKITVRLKKCANQYWWIAVWPIARSSPLCLLLLQLYPTLGVCTCPLCGASWAWSGLFSSPCPLTATANSSQTSASSVTSDFLEMRIEYAMMRRIGLNLKWREAQFSAISRHNLDFSCLQWNWSAIVRVNH